MFAAFMFAAFMLAEVLLVEPPRSISLAGEIVLILMFTAGTAVLAAIFWLMRKIWVERVSIYERIDNIQKDVDLRFDAGKDRFARIEKDLAEVKASLKTNEARTADSGETIEKIERKVDRLDERLDEVTVKLATASSKVEQAAETVNRMAGEVAKFFTDSAPGRGITAKLKRAVREVVKVDALVKAEETLHPDGEENDVYVAMDEQPVQPKSAPRLRPVNHPPSVQEQRKTQPPRANHNHDAPTRPLMRRRQPPESPATGDS